MTDTPRLRGTLFARSAAMHYCGARCLHMNLHCKRSLLDRRQIACCADDGTWQQKFSAGEPIQGLARVEDAKNLSRLTIANNSCRKPSSILLEQRRLETPHLGKMGKKGKGTGSFGELELLIIFDGTVLGGTISNAPRAETL